MVDSNRKDEIRELLLTAASIVCPENPSLIGLATAINVSNKYLYRCIERGEVSPKTAKRIEMITYGAVTRVSLNPRIFG